MSKKKSRGKAAFPKMIGGVKVPKHLRRAAAKLIAAATSPVGLEAIAAGLRMAAAAVEKERAQRRPVLSGARPAGDGDEAAGNTRLLQAEHDPFEIGVAIGKLAEASLAGLFKRKA